MKLTGIECEMVVRALSQYGDDCRKLAVQLFDPTRPEITNGVRGHADLAFNLVLKIREASGSVDV